MRRRQEHERSAQPASALMLVCICALLQGRTSDAQQGLPPCSTGMRVNVTLPRYVCDGKTVSEAEYIRRTRPPSLNVTGNATANATAANVTKSSPTPSATPFNATAANASSLNSTALNATSPSLNATASNSTALNASSSALNSTRLNGTTPTPMPGLNATSGNGTLPSPTPLLINNCTNTTEPGFACVCGVDRYGPFCDEYRNFACGITFEQPACTAEAAASPRYKRELDGDPPCVFLPGRSASPLRLAARLACDFSEADLATVPKYVSRAAFDAARRRIAYWAGTGAGFSVSVDPEELAVRFKPFNWRYLTDLRGVRTARLTPGVATGAEAAEVDLDIAALPDEFFAGGRLYVEATVAPLTGGRGLVASLSGVDRRFVDFADFALPASSTASRLATVLGAVLGSLAAAALLAALALWWYRRRLKKNE